MYNEVTKDELISRCGYDGPTEEELIGALQVGETTSLTVDGTEYTITKKYDTDSGYEMSWKVYKYRDEICLTISDIQDIMFG